MDNWIPVYITGRKGFESVVLNKLNNRWVLGTADLHDGTLMVWLRDVKRLRSFKEAIGAKLLMKYRLRFFMDIEEQLLSNVPDESEFSFSERLMINEMVAWEKRHSGNSVVTIEGI